MAVSARNGQATVFGDVHGGTSRYKTGSHVDVDGISFAAGVTWSYSNLISAMFFEAGHATSDSHVAGTTGDGTHDYYGAGVAMRYSFDSPFYIDAAARFGRADTEFKGSYEDARADYDASGLYSSVHATLGYLLPLSQSLQLDLYGRYTFTYLEGDNTDLGTPDGEEFRMDDTFIHAFCLGSRLYGTLGENASWRAGLAWEHIADGDASSKVRTTGKLVSLATPSLAGDSAVMELGLRISPAPHSPWAFDLGVKGYAGDREGVSGNAQLSYTF